MEIQIQTRKSLDKRNYEAERQMYRDWKEEQEYRKKRKWRNKKTGNIFRASYIELFGNSTIYLDEEIYEELKDEEVGDEN